MVRLAIVRGLAYTDLAQVRRRWLIPTYVTAFRWTGNRPDAEDLTTWIFHKLDGDFRAPELVQVVEERMAELTSEAILRHWSDRYGVADDHLSPSILIDSHPTLGSLLTDLTAEMNLTLILRFVRRRPTATIANQLRVSEQETNRRVFTGLAQVAERIGLPATAGDPRGFNEVSAFVTDLVARRRPIRFEANSGTWPVMVVACHVQAAIAGNELPTRRFVSTLASSNRRPVTDLRIWSA